MNNLNDRILDYIKSYSAKHGYPPSMREIMRACNIASTSVTRYHLLQLERDGLIERDPMVSRGIRILENDRKGEGA